MWTPEQSVEICLELWEDEPCQPFKVPKNGLNRIEVWVHELSELGIKRWFQLRGSNREMWSEGGGIVDMPLNTVYMSKLVSIKAPDGKIQHHKIDHVLTSLVSVSILRISERLYRLIQPDDYEKTVEGILIFNMVD